MGKASIVRASALLLSLALLSGCTAPDEEPAPTATRTPPPTDAPSTTEQWTDIAASQQQTWLAWLEGWDSVPCGSVDQLESAGVDCLVLVYQATDMLQAARDEWVAVTTPGQPGFISTDPPADIASLVADTQQVTTEGADAAAAWIAADCGVSMTGDCTTITTDLGDRMTAYQDQLAVWESFAPAA